MKVVRMVLTVLRGRRRRRRSRGGGVGDVMI